MKKKTTTTERKYCSSVCNLEWNRFATYLLRQQFAGIIKATCNLIYGSNACARHGGNGWRCVRAMTPKCVALSHAFNCDVRNVDIFADFSSLEFRDTFYSEKDYFWPSLGMDIGQLQFGGFCVWTYAIFRPSSRIRCTAWNFARTECSRPVGGSFDTNFNLTFCCRAHSSGIYLSIGKKASFTDINFHL